MTLSMESQIAEWRAQIVATPPGGARTPDELEALLRREIASLTALGLAPDEALLVARKRVEELDPRPREHGDRPGSSIASTDDEHAPAPGGWREPFLFAAAAAIVAQVARLAANFPDEEQTWLARNATLLVLPILAAYFARRRSLGPRGWLVTAAPFVVAALIVNLYPWAASSATEVVVAIHVPVVAWFAVAYPYMGGTARSHERRMAFVRFTGEWFIHFVLIALGGGVLMALTALVLAPTGGNVDLIAEWVLPSGAAGAVVVAAWLVEGRERLAGAIAPVLTMLFTPLFAVMLVVAVVSYAATGRSGVFDRELVGGFDGLLLVVLGLVLYGLSARDPADKPTWMDRVQLVAVCAALVLDAVVLATMAARIGELGFTPNRIAAVGLNVLLLANLAGAGMLAIRFLRGRSTLGRLERWQTAYLPAFAVWAAAVVIVLPPLFSFT